MPSLNVSREALLRAIAGADDLALIRCSEDPSAASALAEARALLDGCEFRELSLEQMCQDGGDTVVLGACDFSRAGAEVAVYALAIAELRFKRVIALPTTVDLGDDRVSDALAHTNATVFAPDPESVADVDGPAERPAELDAVAQATLERLEALANMTPPPPGTEAALGDRVTAVILTRGRVAMLRRTLRSLDRLPSEVAAVVVDNNSPPRLALELQELCAARPRTRLERSERNLGPGGGRNFGVSFAETELVLFIDDDAELLPGALGHLVAELDAHPEALGVTSTVVRDDGSVIHSGGGLDVSGGVATFELLGDGVAFDVDVLPPSGVSGWLPSTAGFVRRDALERFPFDQEVTGYFEDNEWSYRLHLERPDCMRRSREALALHHLEPKHAPAPGFAGRVAIIRLLGGYARFYGAHGVLLGPWLFDHVPELRSPDGSCDVAGARVLMELVLAKGLGWVLMEWVNGDLAGLLSAGDRLFRLREAEAAAAAWNAEATRLQDEFTTISRMLEEVEHELAMARGQVAQDAHTIASLDAALDAANRRFQRVEESVSWQALRRAKRLVIRALGGPDSRAVAVVQWALRFAGRRTSRSGGVGGRPSRVPAARSARPIGPVQLRPSSTPLVSIVMPLYAHAELTHAALQSIAEHTSHVDYEVILVDDSADAGTKELLGLVGGAHVLVNETNLGYMRSIERGVAEARGRWLVLANNDIEVQPGWLSALLECADAAPEIAIVSPKYIYPDGKLAEAGSIIWADGTGANYGRGHDPASCHYEYRREIDYGSAAALLVSADFWREVGGFDERFLPMYYEDTDLCFQARARGLRVMYEPRSRVIHIEGGTAGTDESVGHKRHQESNRPKFVEKWRDRLDAEHLRPPQPDQWLGANLRRRHHVLIVDHRMPMWDRESGALRMRGMIESLLEADAHVSFLPDNLMPAQPYARELQRIGVEVLYGIEVPGDLVKILRGISLAILSRPGVAARWLDLIREHGPGAKVLYDTVDLHWLREARRAAFDAGLGSGGLVMTREASTMKELELGLVRACDMTAVVTERERAYVEADVPGAVVHVLPNVNPVRAHVPGPEQRAGLLFVGGFEHPPNVDAALEFVRDVMPLIWRERDDVEVTIVGPDAPAEVLGLACDRVRVAGWVPYLDPLLESCRAMIAPLSYGAGLKGKVTQALAYGLPVVTTPVGAEGLDAVDGRELLIGDGAEELAARSLRVLADDALWRSLSAAGQELVEGICSPAVMRERIGRIVDTLPPAARAVVPIRGSVPAGRGSGSAT